MTLRPSPLPTVSFRSSARWTSWLLAIFAIGLAGVGLLLVPRGDELAGLTHANAQHVERDVNRLEAQVMAGDRTPASIGTLARARLRRGDLDGSISLLRSWVAERPDDLGALQLLADECRTAKRRTDLLDALERLQKRQPTAIRQREMTDLYAALGMSQQWMQSLVQLIDRFNSGTVADHLTLARLHSEQGEPDKSLQVLDHMAVRFPQALDESVVTLQMKLLLANKDGPAAMIRANAWLRTHPREMQGAAADFGATFSAQKRPDLAVQLLDSYLTGPDPEPRLLSVWAQAMVDLGRSTEALNRLEPFVVTGDRTGELLQLRISLADTALTTGQNELLRRIVSSGDADIGTNNPVLAAQIALRLGSRASALRWTKIASLAPAGPPIRQLRVARLFEQLGEPGAALEALHQLNLSVVESVDLVELGRLYRALGHAEEGLAMLGRIPASSRQTPWHESWALLATAAGRDADVLRWLHSEWGAKAEGALLRDLMFVATDRKAYALATAVGERLTKVSDNPQDRSTLARVLLTAGRASDALVQLRVLRQRGVVDAPLYRQTLEAAWRTDASAADELRRDILSHLASPRDPVARDADIALLQAMGAFAELIPVIEPLALANPQRWLGAFTEASQRAGRQAPLLAMWRRLGESGSTPSALRTQVAFRLLEAGDKTSAERVFRSLASSAAPEDAVTRQLLFVWGPRPQSAQMDWLEARARTASRDTKARWLRLLAERGGAARVVKLVDKSSRQTEAEDVFEVLLDALQTTGDKAALRVSLQENAARSRSAPVLVHMARLAGLLRDAGLERQLLDTALAAGAQEPQLHKALGLLAYRVHDIPTAERWLAAFNAATGGDYETYRALGEIRLQRRDVDGARQSFELAMTALERSGDTDPPAQAAKASLLHRLGRTAEARQQYDALIAKRPQDDDLRADYVSMLLSIGDPASAQTLLTRSNR